MRITQLNDIELETVSGGVADGMVQYLISADSMTVLVNGVGVGTAPTDHFAAFYGIDTEGHPIDSLAFNA